MQEDLLSLAARPHGQRRDPGSQLHAGSESVGVVEVGNNPACTTLDGKLCEADHYQ